MAGGDAPPTRPTGEKVKRVVSGYPRYSHPHNASMHACRERGKGGRGVEESIMMNLTDGRGAHAGKRPVNAFNDCIGI